jgi:hypothetical protein
MEREGKEKLKEGKLKPNDCNILKNKEKKKRN